MRSHAFYSSYSAPLVNFQGGFGGGMVCRDVCTSWITDGSSEELNWVLLC